MNPYQSGAQIVGCPDCVYVLSHSNAMGSKPNLGIPIWAQIGCYVKKNFPDCKYTYDLGPDWNSQSG